MLKEQIKLLVKLQALYTKAAAVDLKLKSIPGRSKLLDDKLESLEKAIKAEEGTLNEQKKKYRSCKSDAKDTVSRISRSTEKLDLAKKNQEYEALVKEIANLKEKNSVLEDEMLKLLDMNEVSESLIATKKEEFSKLSEKVKSDKEAMKKEAERHKKKIVKLKAQQKDIGPGIDEKLYKTFSAIRERLSYNRAIVRIKDSVCLGCNVNMPPQLYNEVQRGDKLFFCSNCQRIIYWEPDKEV